MISPWANFISFFGLRHFRPAEVLSVRFFCPSFLILQDSSLDLFPRKLYNLYKLVPLFFLICVYFINFHPQKIMFCKLLPILWGFYK